MKYLNIQLHIWIKIKKHFYIWIYSTTYLYTIQKSNNFYNKLCNLMTKRWIFLSENHLNLLSERCKESSDSLGRSHSLDVGDLGDLSGSDLIGSFSSSSSLISLISSLRLEAGARETLGAKPLSYLSKKKSQFCNLIRSVDYAQLETMFYQKKPFSIWNTSIKINEYSSTWFCWNNVLYKWHTL